MDIQNTGNNFPTFYQKCREDLKFVRTIPVDMYQAENDCIKTRFMSETDGSPVEEEFDLLVLSVGIMPGKDIGAPGRGARHRTGQRRLLRPAQPPLRTVATNQAGIFLAGTVQGPQNHRKHHGPRRSIRRQGD